MELGSYCNYKLYVRSIEGAKPAHTFPHASLYSLYLSECHTAT